MRNRLNLSGTWKDFPGNKYDLAEFWQRQEILRKERELFLSSSSSGLKVLVIVVQQCQLMACEAVSDGYSADPGDVDKRRD